MEEVPIPYREDDGQLFRRVFARYSVPAYVRRAKAVEDAFEQLLNDCTNQRQECLKDVRSRLVAVVRLSDWNALLPYLADEKQLLSLQDLCRSLDVTISMPANANAMPSCRRSLEALRITIVRFNRRWQSYLCALDLRDGYNRYYLLEKECAMRSARLARQGFRRLAPITTDELFALFPLLPVPGLQY
jgi:hypothetical protein